MGLIRWIKKEIESSNLSRRRESAPPPITACVASPDANRDDAYLRAIQKFNEYRQNHRRSTKLNESNKHSKTTTAENNDEHNLKDDEEEEDEFYIISDISMNDEEQQNIKQSMLNRKLENSAVLYSNLAHVKSPEKNKNDASYLRKKNNNTNRLSMPNFMPKSNISKEISLRRKNVTRIVQNNNVIFEDEIDEFEQAHCQNDIDGTYTVTSPPSKFNMKNSSLTSPNLFRNSNVKTPDKGGVAETSNKIGGFMTPRRILGKSHSRKSKGRAPQPPKNQGVESESSELTNYNGSFKHYDFQYSSGYESPTNHLRNNLKISPKINNIEANKNGPANGVPNKEELKVRRNSPPYQTVINKHGDIVEYALPYSEQDTDTATGSNSTLTNDLPPLPTNPPPNDTVSRFEQIINEQFVFLADESELNQRLESALGPIEQFSEMKSARDVIITDLDNSVDAANLVSAPSQSKEILRELETLEKWSKNIEVVDDFLRSQGKLDQLNLMKHFRKMQNNIMVFPSSQIKYTSSVLRNSFLLPLEFSTGSYRNTPVTLRKTVPSIYNTYNTFAEDACKKEFEILSKIKHINITILMGICFDQDLNQMSLILEPFDFTLNHYLHQMDKKLTIIQTIYIMEQVASAVQYLHECGFVHSNISSHCVLIRKNPYGVKLSCFELTTQIESNEVFQEVGNNKDLFYKQGHCPSYPVVFQNSDESLKEKYYKLSKQSFYNRNSVKLSQPISNKTDNYKFLPYLVQYRKNFALYHYQAPELLPSETSKYYVVPQESSDIYSLTLLLWECLNMCVPFIIYSELELQKLYSDNKVVLPIFLPDRCENFQEIFDNCLRLESDQRTKNIGEFLMMLQQSKLNCISGNLKGFLIDFEEEMYSKNFPESAKFEGKIYEKPSISSNNMQIQDFQCRRQNVITVNDLSPRGDESNRYSESCKSSEIEPNIVPDRPGILMEDLTKYMRPENVQKSVAPKKPARKRREPSTEGLDRTDSTMYRSFLDFQINTPKPVNGIYERTSTLKKRLKATESEPKKSAKELFGLQDKTERNSEFDKINNELNQMCTEINGNDFVKEICTNNPPEDSWYTQKKKEEPEKYQVNKFQDTPRRKSDIPRSTRKNNSIYPEIPMEIQQTDEKEVESPNIPKIVTDSPSENYQNFDKAIHDRENLTSSLLKKRNALKNQEKRREPKKSSLISDSYCETFEKTPSKSFEVLPYSEGRRRQKSSQENQLNGSYRFTIGDFSLPKTPIARNSKLLRYAWLQDKKTTSPAKYETAERPLSDIQIKDENNFDLEGPKNLSDVKRQFNINIKIQREREAGDTMGKLNDSLINISCRLPNESMEDINRKYYPNMPEMFSEAIQKQRERSFMNLSQKNDERFEKSLWRKELSRCRVDSEPDVSPHHTSVKDLVKFIESTYKTEESSPNMPKNTTMSGSQKNEFTPLSNRDSLDECMQKAHESINKLCNLFQNQNLDEKNTEKVELNRRLDFEECANAIKIVEVAETSKEQEEEQSGDENPKSPQIQSLESLDSLDSKNQDLVDAKQKSSGESEVYTDSLESLNTKFVSPSPSPEIIVPEIENAVPIVTEIESIPTKNEEVQKEMNPPIVIIKKITDPTEPAPKKKITTKVTVNFKKISRRSSDVGMDLARKQHLLKISNQCGDGDAVRHSICSSNELLHRISTQLKRTTEEETGEASAQTVVSTERTSEMCGTLRPKYFCRNCGFTMLPERLQQIGQTGRISIASSLIDETGNLLPSIRRCQILETKSTEDLYIDDDFCQGFSLGANMELLPPPNDFFGSIDFDILSAEIFHTQEHEEYAPLEIEAPNKNQGQIEYVKEDEDKADEKSMDLD